MHWTLAGAAAGAGRHQRSAQHGARQGREEGDSCWPEVSLALGRDSNHNSTLTLGPCTLHIHMHINMHMQTKINLNALFMY